MSLPRSKRGIFRAWCGALWCAGCIALGYPVVAAELFAGDAYWSSGHVAVPIYLDAPTGEEITGLQFDLGFDPAQYAVHQATLGDGPAATGKQPVLTDVVPGTARLLITGFNQDPIPSGLVATLYLTPQQTSSQIPGFPLDHLLATDPFGFPVDMQHEPPPAPAGDDDSESPVAVLPTGTQDNSGAGDGPESIVDAALEALGVEPPSGIGGVLGVPYPEGDVPESSDGTPPSGPVPAYSRDHVLHGSTLAATSVRGGTSTGAYSVGVRSLVGSAPTAIPTPGTASAPVPPLPRSVAGARSGEAYLEAGEPSLALDAGGSAGTANPGGGMPTGQDGKDDHGDGKAYMLSMKPGLMTGGIAVGSAVAALMLFLLFRGRFFGSEVRSRSRSSSDEK